MSNGLMERVETALQRDGLSLERLPEHVRANALMLAEHIDSNRNISRTGRYLFARTLTELSRSRIAAERQFVGEFHKGHLIDPIFVIGLPRTGTTYLLNLLSGLPGARSIKNWQISYPLFTGGAAEMEDVISSKQGQIDRLYERYPAMKLSHHELATDPTECDAILNHEFLSFHLDIRILSEDYFNFLITSDMRNSYRFHRSTLTALSQGVEGIWILKSPVHSFFLDQIVDVYPSARFVTIRRDAAQTAPSTAALLAAMSSPYLNPLPAKAYGRAALLRLETISERLAQSRAALTDRIFTLNYDELVRQPLASIRRTCEHFGLGMDRRAEEHIGDLASSARARTVSSYSCDDFDISQQDLSSIRDAIGQEIR